MVSNVKVIYGLSVTDCSLSQFTQRLFKLVSNCGVDCNIRLTRTSVTAEVYPFKTSGAKQMSEKDGADMLRSLIYLFENCFDNGHLLLVDMSESLPF